MLAVSSEGDMLLKMRKKGLSVAFRHELGTDIEGAILLEKKKKGLITTLRRELGTDVEWNGFAINSGGAILLDIKKEKPPTMIEYGIKTDVGRVRASNQDACATADPRSGLQFAVVCDGMGGHSAGEIASDIAVRTIVEVMMRGSEIDLSNIRRAIEISNTRVYRHSLSNEGCFGMGTTLVMAVMEPETVYIANVGDSRAYHYSAEKDTLRQITTDHSLVEELVATKQISRKDAESFPFKNIITRAIGSAEDVKADIFELAWKRGDLILLCSDGLSRHLSEDLIKEKISKNADPQTICEEMVEYANNDGGKDNITVVLARYAEGGERQ